MPIARRVSVELGSLLALDVEPFVVSVGEAVQLDGTVTGVGGAVHISWPSCLAPHLRRPPAA